MVVRAHVMSIENWLDDLLPTKWGRRVALAAIMLSGSSYYLPSLLPSSFLPDSEEQVFFIRLVLSLSVLIIGSLIVIFIVVRAFHAQAAAHKLQLESINKNKMNRPIIYPNNRRA